MRYGSRQAEIEMSELTNPIYLKTMHSIRVVMPNKVPTIEVISSPYMLHEAVAMIFSKMKVNYVGLMCLSFKIITVYFISFKLFIKLNKFSYFHIIYFILILLNYLFLFLVQLRKQTNKSITQKNKKITFLPSFDPAYFILILLFKGFYLND